MRRRVLFVCDGGEVPEIGTGHVIRCLLLADALTARGAQCAFLGRLSPRMVQRVGSSGYSCEAIGPDDDHNGALERVSSLFCPDVIVLDRLENDPALLSASRSCAPVAVSLDDVNGDEADMVVNAIVGGPDPYSDFSFLVIPRPADERPSPVAGRVVVSLGGYDSGHLGPKVAAALASEGRDIVVAGDPPAGAAGLAGITYCRPSTSDQFTELLRSAEVAVVNGGLTALEAVANRVPSVGIPRYEHQAKTLEGLARAGACEIVRAENPNGQVAKIVDRLLSDEHARRRMGDRGAQLIDGAGLARVTELLTVIQRLDWDSEFFGLEIGRIFPRRLNERILDFALKEIESAGLECVYYLCDCNDAESVRLAEGAGFHFTDIRLTLECASRRELRPNPAIRPGRVSDIPALEDIASAAYIYSRYWFDQGFSREDCQRFYENWVAKCVSEPNYAQTFVYGREGERPSGFIAVRRQSASTGAIILLGVANGARGQGLGPALIEHALDWAARDDLQSLEVVTQGRNYAAQRAYQRAGFTTGKVELWYHLWRPQLGRAHE